MKNIIRSIVFVGVVLVGFISLLGLLRMVQKLWFDKTAVFYLILFCLSIPSAWFYLMIIRSEKTKRPFVLDAFESNQERVIPNEFLIIFNFLFGFSLLGITLFQFVEFVRDSAYYSSNFFPVLVFVSLIILSVLILIDSFWSYLKK